MIRDKTDWSQKPEHCLQYNGDVWRNSMCFSVSENIQHRQWAACILLVEVVNKLCNAVALVHALTWMHEAYCTWKNSTARSTPTSPNRNVFTCNLFQSIQTAMTKPSQSISLHSKHWEKNLMTVFFFVRVHHPNGGCGSGSELFALEITFTL